MMRRKRKMAPATFADIPEPYRSMSLPDIVRGIVEGQKELDRLDDEIGRKLAAVEREFRKRYTAGRPVDVPFPPWGKLAWSGRRGRWRLVVLEEDDCTDLLTMPQLCRIDACHVLYKLAERMDLL